MEDDNPLAFLGLQRVGGDNSPTKSEPIELNNRGLPARKRKKNSLIFGGDELVAIPVRSPRKKSPTKVVSPVKINHASPVKVSPSKLAFSSPAKTKSQSPLKVNNSVDNKPGSRLSSPAKKTVRYNNDTNHHLERTNSGVSDKISVHINSNDVRRLARIELDSLLNDSTTSRDQKVVREDDGFSEYSDTDPDDDDDSDHLDLHSQQQQHNNLQQQQQLKSWSRTKPKFQPVVKLEPSPMKVVEEAEESGGEDDNISTVKRLNAQRLGVALRNLLKLPKAHKWVCFEFFYSNIDKVLFCSGENDFIVCLKESFPHLKTRRLTRVEWCKVRRLMGKPRRCSPAFFTEERQELERKRDWIRGLQQRKLVDPASLKILPTEDIPMQLTIGAKVTARLRSPQDGLYCGTVDAVDPSTSTYRITFDRPGLGTHSIPDYEVLSIDPPDLLPVVQSTSTQPQHRGIFLSNAVARSRLSGMGLGGGGLLGGVGGGLMGGGGSRPGSSLPSPAKYVNVHSPLTNDPLLSGSVARSCALRMDQVLGGYPVRYLYNIVKLNKCLKTKKEKVDALKELNTEAETRKSYGAVITEDYQKKYASTVLDIYRINEELNSFLREVSVYTSQLGNEEGPSLSLPDQIRDNCQEEAYVMVNKYNCSGGQDNNTGGNNINVNSQADEEEAQEEVGEAENKQGSVQTVHSAKVLALITQLSALMLQIKRVADGEKNASEMQALKDSVDRIRVGLSDGNSKIFEDTAGVHMHLIQQELAQDGNLAAFNIKKDDDV